jgi:hypothetical protein
LRSLCATLILHHGGSGRRKIAEAVADGQKGCVVCPIRHRKAQIFNERGVT